MSKKPIVSIVGSINMDLTITTNKMPMQGETVLGNDFATYPGGKGANQAVAAARLGANVNMIGAVGSDSFGKTLLNYLETEGINIEGVHTATNKPTGIANIILSEDDNRIIVASGANKLVLPELVEKHVDLIKHSDVLLLQLEIPIETVMYTLKVASKYNVPIIVNPAPYQPLPDALFKATTYLTPNEIEAESIKNDLLFESIKEKLIVTTGDKGVQYFENGTKQFLPSYQVEVKDTTGAGDTFNGAFATKLGIGASITEAVQFANAAAALSVTKVGAQSGMPKKQEVEQFLKERSGTK
ncbi:ribokinase [Aquibacillus sp. 3ASR75-11]|uniref:Ribokinase n=1 Tax=Terrihalobacillus insolitus TaxID=2950438 RepID=A0A9X4AMA1_9BACI|nr:ribokinase [Terrihalobacillus insolitus]MDC3423280.1 ribokinase [Terrihalobacillus insolitus]